MYKKANTNNKNTKHEEIQCMGVTVSEHSFLFLSLGHVFFLWEINKDNLDSDYLWDYEYIVCCP